MITIDKHYKVNYKMAKNKKYRVPEFRDIHEFANGMYKARELIKERRQKQQK
jgi:hypothetical protein